MRQVGLLLVFAAMACPIASGNAQTVPSQIVQYPNITRAQVGLSSRTAPNSGIGTRADFAIIGDRVSISGARRSIARALDSGNYARALGEAAMLADSGDAWANRYLGWIYTSGLGVAPDTHRAFRHFQEAARAGDAPAALALGLAYQRGYGVEADAEQADYWLTRARRHGNSKIRRDAARLQRGG